MKLPGGMDLNAMMQQAQEMQEKMGREMKETVVAATAGGGAVSVKMRGDFEVVSRNYLAGSRQRRRCRDAPRSYRRRSQRGQTQGRGISQR